MELIKGIENRSTNNHLKYQETYKNLKVFGAVYILHENDGIVESANGLIYPKIDFGNSTQNQRTKYSKICH